MEGIERNPSRVTVRRLLRTHGALRATRDFLAGDAYVWPAHAATHNEVLRALGLDHADSGAALYALDDWDRVLAAPDPFR